MPFLLQIIAAVGATSYLSIRNGHRAVNSVADQLRQEVATRVDGYLSNFMEKPLEINQLNAQLIGLNKVDIDTGGIPEDLSWRFWNQSRSLGEEVPLYIYFGNTAGGFVGAGIYELDEKPVIEYTSRFEAGDLYSYVADAAGSLTDEPGYPEGAVIAEDYDARERPWYPKAVSERQATWTEVYASPEGDLGITASQPVYDLERQLLGVSAVDFSLRGIDAFLEQIRVGETGQVFVIERDGSLISSSTGRSDTVVPGEEEAKRLKATESKNSLIQSTGEALQAQFTSLDAIQQEEQLQFEIEGRRQFASVIPLDEKIGLDWLVVVVVPEADFLAQINENTKQTIGLSLLALLISAGVGILAAQWIAKPVRRLTKAAEAIAAGDLTQQARPAAIAELNVLARSFNQMVSQLKTSFDDLEHRVQERTVELSEAKVLADSANQAKSEFLANMSHELRTPLNGILGYAQILGRSKVIPEKERHGVSIIHQCGTHLLTLINDILDLSKIEARKLELVPQAIHFPSFLQGVGEICRIRAEQKEIAFHYEPDAQLPTGILADEKRLRQVLINLIGNAIKFTDKGSVSLRVEVLAPLEQLGVLEELDGCKIRFTVADTGVGIAPEDLEKLFKAFEQVGEKNRQAEGTGLGLAISKQIVELMGGQIQVKSQLGSGSDFFFEVALPRLSNWSQQQTRSVADIIGYEGEKRHVLVVDDRWENRAVLLNLLEPLGFIITEAANGEEGLAKMRQARPDIVITDLAMPVMDGFEMLKQLRADDNLKSLKVIVSSASVAQLDQQMSLDAGGDDFLSKPVQVSDLFSRLEKYLELTWQEEASVEEVVAQTTPTETLVTPPASDLEAWFKLSQEGRLKKLISVAEALALQSAEYQPFIRQITQLARTFQSEKLEDLIQQHLSK